MKLAAGRRSLLLVASAIVLVVTYALGEDARPAERRPNVLFIMADQWRFSAFSHSTDPGVKTPNMDRLAAQGVRFTKAYATVPVCSPNRAVILTGRYGHQTGVVANDLMLPPTERSMAHVMAEAGYRTHYIGKLHLDGEGKGFVPPGWRRRGFEGFEGFNTGHRYFRWDSYDDEGAATGMRVYQPTYQTARAIAYMEEHADEPFYLFLSWGPPHQPYTPPKDFRRRDMKMVPLRPNVPEDTVEDTGVVGNVKGYYGHCAALDAEMARLLEALDRLGLSEDTIVAFTADHGDMLGSHGLFNKGVPYEEAMHIPLFLSQPGRIPAESTPALPVTTIDLMPTLLGLCGIDPPAECEGRDLSSFVLGAEVVEPTPVYCQGRMTHKDAWRAIVTERHKLVVDVDEKVTHLFDLEEDPYELENLVENPESGALRENLLSTLLRRAKAIGDPFPEPVEAAEAMYELEER